MDDMDGMDERPSGNLPAELPTFVGRTAEVAEIGGLLRTSRLVTLTGVAGVGKSRTALRVGEDVAERFPDGVWLIPLSQLRDGMLVPHAVALTMKVRDQTARPMIDLLVEYLTERRCLIILDTCEHLVDACAALVTTLREAAGQTCVLATSRQPLGVDGEAVVELAPLAVPADPVGEPGRPAAYASVALFAERARQVDPGFEVTKAGPAAVARLCRRLDGLPLALELAAAGLRERTVEELADRPDVPARSDTGGEVSSVLAPHGGLWTAIGWSHELCTPAERLLWARASVFAGSFTAEALEEVCSGGPVGDVLRTLEDLAGKSILVREGERYRLLDSLREYGASWLRELGEDRAIQIRHRDRYLTLARLAFPEWTRSGQAHWYQSLAEDYPEVRLAIETSLAEPGPIAVELTGALWFFWFSCEYEREGRRYLERALAHDATPGPARVRAAWAMGCVMIAQGDINGIERCIAECRSATPDATALRAADYIEGTDWAMGGRPDLALKRLVDLAAAHWAGSVQEAVWLLARAALVFAHLVMGDLTSATTLAEDIRVDGQRRGEHKFRCWGHYILALIAYCGGDRESATRHAREAFDGFNRLNDSSNMALSLEVLAIATAPGDPERAAVLLGISQRLWSPGGGRDRFTSPQLATARKECEETITAAVGRTAMDAFYETGKHSSWP